MARLGRSQPFKPIILSGLVRTLTPISGGAAWTEANDTWAISASVVTDASAAWTEVNDSWSISGSVAWNAAAAWTEVNDAWAVSASVIIDGAVSWTEVQDSWAISAQLGVFGGAAWTEANDLWAIAGTITLPAVSGDAAWTEAQDNWAAQGDNGILLTDTHDGHKKKEEKRRQKLIKDERDRQERRRAQVIAAFEQVIEPNVSCETSNQQVIAAVADYAVNTLELNDKSAIDFQSWVSDIANTKRILADYLEADDEEVLLLL